MFTNLILCLYVLIVTIYITDRYFYIIEWTIHRSMNIDQKKLYKYISFEEFLIEFNNYKEKYNLQKDKNYKGIIESYSKHEINKPYIENRIPYYIVYIHASIIEFEGTCRIIKLKDYKKFKFWFDNLFIENKND